MGWPDLSSFPFKALLQALLGAGYPFLIFLSLSRFEPRETALAVLVLTGMRFAITRPAAAASAVKEIWILALAVAAVVLTTVVLNDPIGLLLAPVLISAVFLFSFGLSLQSGRPMVERFARLQVGSLSEDEVRYCRTVTWVWCAFFIVNGLICLLLAVARDLNAWTIYTGFISYVLMGLIFSLEYIYRHWRFRRYVGGFADPLLKRVFPPHSLPTRRDQPTNGVGSGRTPHDPG